MRTNLILILLLFLLAGCGGGKNTPATVTPGEKLAYSQKCINCHTTDTSPETGNLIMDEWKASLHNSRDAAGCADCHEPINHPSSSCALCHSGNQLVGVDEIQRNPDKASKCQKCHDDPLKHGLPVSATFGYSEKSTRNGVTLGVQKAHFNNMTGTEYRKSGGSFISYTNTTGTAEFKVISCRKCHNPHDTTTALPFNRDWSRNAHGSTAAVVGVNSIRIAARNDRDFMAAGSHDLEASQVSLTTTTNRGCIICHTTTGYINYVESGFKKLTPFGPVDPATGRAYELSSMPTGTFFIPQRTGRELTGCSACHTGYNWKIRTVGQVTAFYNFSAPGGNKLMNYSRLYPNTNTSNQCLVCHVGRLIGDNIKIIDIRGQSLSNPPSISNHNRAAGQAMFQTGGFEFYSSNSTKLLDYSSPKYSHRYIGMNEKAPNGAVTYAGDLRGYGPCIGCHMNSNKSDGMTSHTFLPVNASASSTGMPGAMHNQFQSDSLPKPIDTIVSKACPSCHHSSAGSGIPVWTPALLQAKKEQYWAAVVALREFINFSLHSNPAKRIGSLTNPYSPPRQTNWYQGVTGDNMQLWLQSTDKEYLTAKFTDPKSGVSKQLHKAIYNMGSWYNAMFMISDPGAFAHNSLYAKRLMYDTLDYLDDGIINRSVAQKLFGGDIVGTNSEIFNVYKRLQDLGYDAQKAYDYLMADSNGKRP